MKYWQVAHELMRAGWCLVESRGATRIFSLDGRRVYVPAATETSTVPLGLVQKILRTAGIS